VSRATGGRRLTAEQRRERDRHRRWRLVFDPLWTRLLSERMGPGWDGLPSGDDGVPLWLPDVYQIFNNGEVLCYVPTSPESAAEWVAEAMSVLLKGGDPRSVPKLAPDPSWLPSAGKPKAKRVCSCCGRGVPTVCAKCAGRGR